MNSSLSALGEGVRAARAVVSQSKVTIARRMAPFVTVAALAAANCDANEEPLVEEGSTMQQEVVAKDAELPVQEFEFSPGDIDGESLYVLHPEQYQRCDSEITDSIDVSDYMERAANCATRLDFEGAQTLYAEVLSEEPDNIAALRGSVNALKHIVAESRELDCTKD
jgi:hypothetical protein